MNNEALNSNIVNTNINSMPGVTQAQNATPAFGGRFFPSLEDEQTNMGLNSQIDTATLQPTAQVQAEPTVTNQSPLIDLTDLGNDLHFSNNNMATTNAQLEPTPNFSNPTLDSLNQQPFTDINQSLNIPNQQAPFELPQQNNYTNLVQTSETVTPNPSMPNLDSLSVSQPSMIDMSQLNPANLNQSDISNLTNINQQFSSPIDMTKINGESSLEIPNIERQVPEMPQSDLKNDIGSVPQFEQDLNISSQPTKDITPAINTIKSLIEIISSLGYRINLNETDLATSYNIIVEIQK